MRVEASNPGQVWDNWGKFSLFIFPFFLISFSEEGRGREWVGKKILRVPREGRGGHPLEALVGFGQNLAPRRTFEKKFSLEASGVLFFKKGSKPGLLGGKWGFW